MNDTTRRYPRTLQQAFGPLTSTQFEGDEKLAPHEIVLCTVALVAVAVVAAILVLEALA